MKKKEAFDKLTKTIFNFVQFYLQFSEIAFNFKEKKPFIIFDEKKKIQKICMDCPLACTEKRNLKKKKF